MKTQSWLSALQSPEEEERYQAIAHLSDAHSMEAASPLLELLLKERSETVCCAAVLALAELGGPESLEALHQQTLQEEYPQLRERAIWALGYRGDPASLPLLSKLLHEEGGARHAAAQALAQSQGGPVPELPLSEREQAAESRDREEAAAYLETLRSSEDPDERLVAAEALSQIASTRGNFPEFVGPLLDALTDPLEAIQECAIAGLIALSAKTECPPVGRLLEVVPRFPGLAVAAGSWGLIDLAPCLRDWAQGNNRFLADQACQSLARLNDPQAAPLLVKLVKSDRSASSRVLAAEYLGRQDVSTGLAALMDTLKGCRPSDTGEVVRAVAGSLGRLAHADAAPVLTEAFKRHHPKTQKKKPTDFLARRDLEEHLFQSCVVILEALGQIGDPATEPLLVGELLKSPHAVMRSTAALALANYSSKASREALAQAEQDHQPRVSDAARKALATSA